MQADLENYFKALSPDAIKPHLQGDKDAESVLIAKALREKS